MSLLTPEQQRVKEQIIKHGDIIKKKLMELKKGTLTNMQVASETFKPITSPLTKLVELTENKRVKSDKSEPVEVAPDTGTPAPLNLFGHAPPPTPYLKLMNSYLSAFKDDYADKSSYDDVYGPEYSGGKYMLGNKELVFNSNGTILRVGSKQFQVTPGLMELIFKKTPKIYKNADLRRYGEIINITKVHKDEFGSVIRSRRRKFISIIYPLIKHSTGKGLRKWNRAPVDYKYWSDPNILVDRLRLLIASSQSGNNSHGDEIREIIDELCDKGYINDE